MKRIINLLMILGAAGYLSSCYDMESAYKEYVVPNGIIYPQKADSLKVYSGKNRVLIEWLRGNDPKVVSARVFWNNYTDSVVVDVTAYQDTVRYIIDNLPEEDFTFYVKTYDAAGNVSIVQEVSGTVYGTIYESSLRVREITTIDAETYDKVEINWAVASTEIIRTEIQYVSDKTGQNVIRIIPPDETKTILTDEPTNQNFTVLTWYSPSKEALDLFSATRSVKYRVVPPDGVLINDIIWAKYNVDAPGTFAATPEARGMIYQWNRPAAWNALGTVSGWDPTLPAGDSWTDANDPSPEGWRIPTGNELNSLLDATKVTGSWTTQNGANGLLLTDIASGKTLFLPVAGYRGQTAGALDQSNSNGYYWSSTAAGDNAYILRFNSGLTQFTTRNRIFGQSVRSVRK
jgi:uncharacterized protein (TIGR02145 family)